MASKFNATFRLATAAVADELGLVLFSTKRQIENGTLEFYDPHTDVKYAIYESGYIRRFIRKSVRGMQLEHVWNVWTGYQLNPQQNAFGRNERILIDNPNEQLGIMVRAIVNYRKNK